MQRSSERVEPPQHASKVVDKDDGWHMRRRARQVSLLRAGLQVVLDGLPNVGKSSLLNKLTGSDRAIISAVAGTTRDVIDALLTTALALAQRHADARARARRVSVLGASHPSGRETIENFCESCPRFLLTM